MLVLGGDEVKASGGRVLREVIQGTDQAGNSRAWELPLRVIRGQMLSQDDHGSIDQRRELRVSVGWLTKVDPRPAHRHRSGNRLRLWQCKKG